MSIGVPHDVVRAPGVIEEVEVKALFELWLLASEIERRLNAERDQRGVWRQNGQFVIKRNTCR